MVDPVSEVAQVSGLNISPSRQHAEARRSVMQRRRRSSRGRGNDMQLLTGFSIAVELEEGGVGVEVGSAEG